MYTFVSFTVEELFEKVWQTPMVVGTDAELTQLPRCH